MATLIDMGGNTLITENVRVGATGPGQAGTDISSAELTFLDGAATTNAVASKAAIIGSDGILNLSSGSVRVKQDVSNVHDTTPTAASLTAAFGSPATLGRGFVATVDDADGDTNGYLVYTSDASWYWLKFTKAL